MNALIRTARPKQWTKNVLVFAAPGAAGVLDEPKQLGLTCLAFVAMCLASSGTYYWNDAMDVESDRAHPTKRFRPIASGSVSIRMAHVVGTLLIVGALGVAATTGRWQTVAVVATYLAVTLTYSAIWKHIAVVDLVAIASGFVLRAAAGAVAVDVPMSSWFVLCITFGSLFIVTGKRFAESRELGEDARTLRSTLGEYSEGFLRFVLALACGGALVSYCMWAFERRDLVDAQNHFYELSIVPMLIALLRYLLILEQGHGGAPEEVFAADRSLQAFGVIWLITFALGVYVG